MQIYYNTHKETKMTTTHNKKNGKAPNTADDVVTTPPPEALPRPELEYGRLADLTAEMFKHLAACITDTGQTTLSKQSGIGTSCLGSWRSIAGREEEDKSIRSVFYFKIYPFLERYYVDKNIPFKGLPIPYPYSEEELTALEKPNTDKQFIQSVISRMDTLALTRSTDPDAVSILKCAETHLDEYMASDKAGIFAHFSKEEWLERVLSK